MTALPPSARRRFPAKRRLRWNREFVRVREKGRTIRGALLMLGILRVEENEELRFGFVTSKRVGGAVIRNRVRRRLREIVRRHQFAVRPGHWLVIVARASAAKGSSAELEKDWLRLCERGQILRVPESERER